MSGKTLPPTCDVSSNLGQQETSYSNYRFQCADYRCHLSNLDALNSESFLLYKHSCQTFQNILDPYAWNTAQLHLSFEFVFANELEVSSQSCRKSNAYNVRFFFYLKLFKTLQLLQRVQPLLMRKLHQLADKKQLPLIFCIKRDEQIDCKSWKSLRSRPFSQLMERFS